MKRRILIFATSLLVGLAAAFVSVHFWFENERISLDSDFHQLDFASARTRLTRVRWWAPADANLLLLGVQIERRAGHLDDAESKLTKYAAIVGESSFSSRLEAAMISAQRGEIETVVRFLGAQIDASHPLSEQILESFAMGSVGNYHFDRAGFWVEELLTRSPKNPIGRLLKAQTLQTFGKDDDARELLEGIVADFPRFTKAREALAGSHLIRHQFEKASEHYRVLLDRDPDSLLALVGLVRCFDKLNQFDQAGPILKKLRAKADSFPEAALLCGKAALKQLQFEAGAEFFKKTIDLSPFDRDAHLGYAACLEQLDRREEAQAHAKKALEIEADAVLLEKTVNKIFSAPKDPAPRVAAGKICLRNGQIEEASRWLFGAVQLDPNLQEAHHLLADIFASRNDKVRADFHRKKGN